LGALVIAFGGALGWIGLGGCASLLGIGDWENLTDGGGLDSTTTASPTSGNDAAIPLEATTDAQGAFQPQDALQNNADGESAIESNDAAGDALSNSGPKNLIVNGDLSMGTYDWVLTPNYEAQDASLSLSPTGELCTTAGPANAFTIGWPNNPDDALALSAGTTYELSLDMSSSADAGVLIRGGLGGPRDGAIIDEDVEYIVDEGAATVEIAFGKDVAPFNRLDFDLKNETLGPTFQTYAYAFTPTVDDPAGGLALNFVIGYQESTVCIGNVSLTALDGGAGEPLVDAESPGGSRVPVAFVQALDPEGPEIDVTVYSDGSAERTSGSVDREPVLTYPPGDAAVLRFLTDLVAAGDVSMLVGPPACAASEQATYVVAGSVTSGNLQCTSGQVPAVLALAGDCATLAGIAITQDDAGPSEGPG
jgi:hypothetical protein